MSAAETALRSKVSLAWAYATVVSLSATLFALQTSEVRAQTFDFSFSGNLYNTNPAVSSITRGVITGSGGVVTSISGFASGMSSTGLSGNFSFSSSDIDPDNSDYYYTNSSGYLFDVSLYTGPEFKISYGTDVSYVDSYWGTSVVTLRSVAVPEIDGSVVPRAAFVMMGLFWIFKSRQRRLRLAEA